MISLEEIQGLSPLMREAGRAILSVYDGDLDVQLKENDSPLTEADRRANAIIANFLSRHYPDTPVISEETKEAPWSERNAWNNLWLVDPLDGTKEFINRNGEFTVNIAYISNGEPTGGFVYQPVGEISYYAAKDAGAFRQLGDNEPIPIKKGPHYSTLDKVRVVASRSHMTDEVREFLARLEQEGKSLEVMSSGSSLKICLVASGDADLYPRFGPTMEWDTAAAHAIASEAGCNVNEFPSGSPLKYNKQNLLNPWFIVE